MSPLDGLTQKHEKARQPSQEALDKESAILCILTAQRHSGRGTWTLLVQEPEIMAPTHLSPWVTVTGKGNGSGTLRGFSLGFPEPLLKKKPQAGSRTPTTEVWAVHTVFLVLGVAGDVTSQQRDANTPAARQPRSI